MRATLLYDYARGTWIVLNVYSEQRTVTAVGNIKSIFTEEGRYLFPAVVQVAIKSYKYNDGRYSITFEDDVEFPEVETLEQSIQRCKIILQNTIQG
jgi:hypothetical protein